MFHDLQLGRHAKLRIHDAASCQIGCTSSSSSSSSWWIQCRLTSARICCESESVQLQPTTYLFNTKYQFLPKVCNLGRAHRSCFHTTIRNKVPIGYNGTPQVHPQNCPFPSHLIHPSLNWPHSPPKMAIKSNQPFCHSTLSGHTDTQTQRSRDGLGDRSVRILLTLLYW